MRAQSVSNLVTAKKWCPQILSLWLFSYCFDSVEEEALGLILRAKKEHAPRAGVPLGLFHSWRFGPGVVGTLAAPSSQLYPHSHPDTPTFLILWLKVTFIYLPCFLSYPLYY